MWRYLLLACIVVLGTGYVVTGPLGYGPAWLTSVVGGGQRSEAAPHPSRNLPVTVVVAQAVAGSLPIQRDAPGLVVPVASVGLSSPIAGIVSEVPAKDGTDVKANDLIARIDDRSIKASISRDSSLLQRDQASLANADLQLARVKSLLPSGADSRQAEDDAAIAVKVAQAAVAVSQANLDADRITLTQTEIRAPFDGRLGVVSVSPGGYLAPGTVFATLSTMKPLYVEFTLAETHLDLVRSAMAAGKLTFSAAPVLASGSGNKATGPIVFIDNTVDPASGTFKLRALVTNDDGMLWPGQAMDVQVVAGEQPGLVLVPGVAVQPQDDGGLCYVVTSKGTIELRKVKVALRVGNKAGISEGLKAGETVVVEGQGQLMAGTPVEIARVDPRRAEKARHASEAVAKPAGVTP